MSEPQPGAATPGTASAHAPRGLLSDLRRELPCASLAGPSRPLGTCRSSCDPAPLLPHTLQELLHSWPEPGVLSWRSEPPRASLLLCAPGFSTQLSCPARCQSAGLRAPGCAWACSAPCPCLPAGAAPLHLFCPTAPPSSEAALLCRVQVFPCLCPKLVGPLCLCCPVAFVFACISFLDFKSHGDREGVFIAVSLYTKQPLLKIIIFLT